MRFINVLLNYLLTYYSVFFDNLVLMHPESCCYLKFLDITPV